MCNFDETHTQTQYERSSEPDDSGNSRLPRFRLRQYSPNSEAEVAAPIWFYNIFQLFRKYTFSILITKLYKHCLLPHAKLNYKNVHIKQMAHENDICRCICCTCVLPIHSLTLARTHTYIHTYVQCIICMYGVHALAHRMHFIWMCQDTRQHHIHQTNTDAYAHSSVCMCTHAERCVWNIIEDKTVWEKKDGRRREKQRKTAHTSSVCVCMCACVSCRMCGVLLYAYTHARMHIHTYAHTSKCVVVVVCIFHFSSHCHSSFSLFSRKEKENEKSIKHFQKRKKFVFLAHSHLFIFFSLLFVWKKIYSERNRESEGKREGW